MASIGPNNPTAATTDGAGGVNWTGPTNVLAHDTNRASASLTDNDTQISDGLQATGFGFAVPDGSTINGVVVEIERRVSHSTGVAADDSVVRLLKAGVAVGSNLAAGGTWPTTDTYETYGNSSNLWGTTWSVAEVNASNFGVTVSANIALTTASLRSAQINHIRITVYYTAGVADVTGANMFSVF